MTTHVRVCARHGDAGRPHGAGWAADAARHGRMQVDVALPIGGGSSPKWELRSGRGSMVVAGHDVGAVTPRGSDGRPGSSSMVSAVIADLVQLRRTRKEGFLLALRTPDGPGASRPTRATASQGRPERLRWPHRRPKATGVRSPAGCGSSCGGVDRDGPWAWVGLGRSFSHHPVVACYLRLHRDLNSSCRGQCPLSVAHPSQVSLPSFVLSPRRRFERTVLQLHDHHLQTTTEQRPHSGHAEPEGGDS